MGAIPCDYTNVDIMTSTFVLDLVYQMNRRAKWLGQRSLLQKLLFGCTDRQADIHIHTPYRLLYLDTEVIP